MGSITGKTWVDGYTGPQIMAADLTAVEEAIAQLRQQVADLQSAGAAAPIGTVAAFAGATPPAGWLVCDGASVSRTTYAALFKVIGNSYGAAVNSSTFRLPDARGRVIVSRAATGRMATLGAQIGAETVTLTTAQMPSHTHTVQIDGVDAQGWPTTLTSGGNWRTMDKKGNGAVSWITLTPTGGGGSHENVQPSIVMTAIIRAL